MNTIIFFLIALFVSSLLLQIVFYGLLFIPPQYWKKPALKPIKSLPSLSVIVCAKDAGHLLRVNIPLILAQEYPDYELIIIDDNSVDDTAAVLAELCVLSDKIVYKRITTKTLLGKKGALVEALKLARHEHLVLTDADCKPNSNQWLLAYGQQYAQGYDVILGLGLYEHEEGLLNSIIQYETLLTAIQYLSWARIGYPYMAVGRNWGYRKSIVLHDNLLHKLPPIPGGDDDLLFQIMDKNLSVGILCQVNAATISIPQKKFRNWAAQKIRHQSAAVYYKTRYKYALAIFGLSWWLSILLIPLLFVNYFTYTLVFLWFLRLFFLIWRLICWNRILESKTNIFSLLVFDTIYPNILATFNLITLFKKPKKW